MPDVNLNTPPVQPKLKKKPVPTGTNIQIGMMTAEVGRVMAKKDQPYVELILHVFDMDIKDPKGEDLSPTFGKVLEDGTIVDSTAGLLMYLASNNIPVVLEGVTAEKEVTE